MMSMTAVMVEEFGWGWQLGISGEQAIARLDEYTRKIRAEAEQAMPLGIIQMQRAITDEELEHFTSRWNENRDVFRTVQLYSGPPTITPRRTYQAPPVEAFTECPACRIQHYPLITDIAKMDTLDIPAITVRCVWRECQHCHHDWHQQEEV